MVVRSTLGMGWTRWKGGGMGFGVGVQWTSEQKLGKVLEKEP